ncbi:uncharacterized protein LOC105697487 [Orussus abietinus]|uniref:uncharacterized protein LOC105697487 n=1 Tax=Orussus abietinus TaxID=222816 RepID=UPI0006265857|nr:uncharacterized protein LOC105697487 [Orussus abietinus]
MGDKRKRNICQCLKNRDRIEKKATKDKYKRKRQTFVFNPEEEMWHEPYMHCLRKEFSQISIPCDSKIELPWKDIALPAVAMKIRPETTSEEQIQEAAMQDDGDAPEQKESLGKMQLPWNFLLIPDTARVDKVDTEKCDSTLEIPWKDLSLDEPIIIQPPPKEEPCEPDDIEIPWNDILIPSGIVIATTKKKKHPSNQLPPRSADGMGCQQPCCLRMRR